MCGIAGIVDRSRLDRAETLASLTRSMTDAVRHRGPDDDGVWVDADAGVALGQRRLAIVDLTETGRQPMASADGSVVVTYNGELYNHRDLRAELERAGRRFRGTSDTEVLCEAIAVYGLRGAIDRANGMFALAAWQPGERRLTLVRDRLGEKPMYWAMIGEHLVFGSELKALRRHPGLRPQIDRGALASYLRFGYVPAPRTILEGVSKLEAGTMLTLDVASDAAPMITRWWSLLDSIDAPLDVDLGEAADLVEHILGDSVDRRLVADVPVGVFLSGGIDSSTITALATASAPGVRTFSIGFDDGAIDESAGAAAVARHLGTAHTELRVRAADALALVPRLPEIYDEPFTDPSGVPTALVASLAREHVTVALTGDGGDEVFGGYNRYVLTQRVLSATARVPRTLVRGGSGLLAAVPLSALDVIGRAMRLPDPGTKLHKLASLLAAGDAPERFAALAEVWRGDTRLTSAMPAPSVADRARWPVSGSEVEQLMLVDTLLTLPEQMLVKVDRAAMASSLEIRPPFLDHRLVQLAWRLPLHLRVGSRVGKVAIREVLHRHVPQALVAGPKIGFDPPIADWLRGPLRAWADGLLAEGRLAAEGLVEPAVVRRTWREHQSGRRNHDYRLWSVLMLEAWLDRWGS